MIDSKAFLLIEDRPSVVELDRECRYEHKRCSRNECDKRENYIEDTLNEPLLEVKTVVAAEKERRIEEAYIVSASDYDIRDLRRDIGTERVLEAEFEIIVAKLSRNIADDDALVFQDLFPDDLLRLVYAYRLADHILVHTLAHFQNERGSLMASVEYDELSRRIQYEVDLSGEQCPQEDEQKIHKGHKYDR